VSRLKRQASDEDPTEPRRDLAGGRLGKDSDRGVAGRTVGERGLAVESLEQGHAEAVLIRAGVGPFAAPLLRSHISRGSDDAAGVGHRGVKQAASRGGELVRQLGVNRVLGGAREPKVQDEHLPVLVDDDVAGLEVPVNEPLCVSGRKASAGGDVPATISRQERGSLSQCRTVTPSSSCMARKT
jgi:hypothetical protein